MKFGDNVEFFEMTLRSRIVEENPIFGRPIKLIVISIQKINIKNKIILWNLFFFWKY
jgi:hypothetical protein